MITRRDTIVAAIAVIVTTTLVAFAGTAGKPILHCSVFNWSNLKVETTASGERREVFDSPTATLGDLELHITTLDPGKSPHPPHRHPEEELMIMKEGVVEEVFNGNQTNRVEAGGVIFCASNEMHGMKNIGTNRATYYVIKFYPPGLNTNRIASAVTLPSVEPEK